jgi:putative chitinase
MKSMIIKSITATYLKKEPVQSSELAVNQRASVPVGKEYKVRQFSAAEAGHYLVELDYDAGTWYLWSGHWELPWEDHQEQSEIFTLENLKRIMPHATATDIETYCSPINQVLSDFEMTTVPRASAFIAQVAHESGSLRYKEEIASGAAYEGRRDLGNTQPGDGQRFKG